MEFIDSHNHLQNFGKNLEQIILLAHRRNCSTFAVNSANPEDWQRVLALAGRNDCRVVPFVGIHPWNVGEGAEGAISDLELILEEYCCGLGEIGLDHTRKNVSLNEQLSVFDRQLELAVDYMRPVAIHSVKSHAEVLASLKRLPRLPQFMIHSFRGSCQMAREILDLGGLISLSFSLLRGNSDKVLDLLRFVPLSSILLESDSPDQSLPLTEVLLRYDCQLPVIEGLGNFPGAVAELYRVVARIKGLDLELLADSITENFSLFTKDC